MEEDKTYTIFLEIKEEINYLELLKQQINNINAMLDQGKGAEDIHDYLMSTIYNESTPEIGKKAISLILNSLRNATPVPEIRKQIDELSALKFNKQLYTEKQLSRVIELMRESKNPECQKVIAFCQRLPESISLYEAILKYMSVEALYEIMKTLGYSENFEDFALQFIQKNLTEDQPSGEGFPGTSGRLH